jgi:hypothetical protein
MLAKGSDQSEEKEVYTLAEIADKFNVHRRTVARWRERGLFPHARRKTPGLPGSTWLIPSADVRSIEERIKQNGLKPEADSSDGD